MNDTIMLHAACSIYGNPIRTYDNAGSDMFLFRDAGGITGLVKADSWEEAYEIVEDEILQPIEESDIPLAYGFWIGSITENHYDLIDETNSGKCLGSYKTAQEARTRAYARIQACERDLAEGYSYQANATGTGIVCHDLNGEELREIDTATLPDLDIIPIFETDD